MGERARLASSMSADALPRSKKDVDAFVRREILTRIASDAAGDHVDSDKLKAAQQIYDLPFKDVLARGSTWRDFKKDSPQALRYCPGTDRTCAVVRPEIAAHLAQAACTSPSSVTAQMRSRRRSLHLRRCSRGPL